MIAEICLQKNENSLFTVYKSDFSCLSTHFYTKSPSLNDKNFVFL